jgi:hypothetical protein
MLDLRRLVWKHGPSWTALRVDFLHSCGTPWRTLGTPLIQSTRHVRSWPQAGSFIVKWRWRSQCARQNPAWEEWECKAQELNLADTVQKAALEALTIFCGMHPDVVASTVARVIPIPERHTGPWVEREASLSAQGNSHYDPDLVTSVHFSEAMYDTDWLMVGETTFFRCQIYKQRVKKWRILLKHWRKPEQW